MTQRRAEVGDFGSNPVETEINAGVAGKLSRLRYRVKLGAFSMRFTREYLTAVSISHF